MESLAKVPAPSDRRLALHVTPAAERAIRDGHPWLFDRSIRKQNRSGETGDLAVVFDRRDRFLAIGLYDAMSPIRVRILQSRKAVLIDSDWFRQRLLASINRRAFLGKTHTTGYRLVHGENDGLPGLVIDRYVNDLVLKIDTTAWIPYLSLIATSLVEIMPIERMILRLSRQVQRQKELLHGLFEGQHLCGQSRNAPVIFQENALFFEADLIQGQKTGFYLDQRENRARVEGRVRQLKLSRVLNVFAYSGGFSLYAARGGAETIVSVDENRLALEAAKRNFDLNRDDQSIKNANHEMMVGDAFQILEQLISAGKMYDLVVIDPPSFAKKQAEIAGAKKAYNYLAQLGVSVLRPRGHLVMASCSSRVSEKTFTQIVEESANRAGRPILDLEHTPPPLDHPVSFPEGAYLKCLFCVVS